MPGMNLPPVQIPVKALEELFDLLRIPSVSSDPGRRGEVLRAAEFLAAKLSSLGFAARVDATAGHPVIFAERSVSSSLPTALIYGHYDVQPEEPLGGWSTPPFEPTVRNGRIYARGATDDKGQLYAHLMAAQALLAVGDLPVNLKFLLEGEEEVGSPSLGDYIAEHREALSSDLIVISDGSRFAEDVPTITSGVRGLCYLEVRVRGARRDLHSGAYGGAAPNPIAALCALLASLKDASGRILIPGFYDGVLDPPESELQSWSQLPIDPASWCASIGIQEPVGEAGYSLLERLWSRPTLDANGIWGGFQGPGSKTVIPASAGAKVSMRLVPGQDWQRIARLASDYLRAHCPAGVQLEVEVLHGAEPVVLPVDSPAVQAARSALARVFGRPAQTVRTGGSIPVVADFQRLLGAPVILLDFGLDIDAPHSPDESFAVADFQRGILCAAEFLRAIAEQR
jgi:acetylornithine deacetylase/succinyl-diaminopimelate desuccinylase-like protein